MDRCIIKKEHFYFLFLFLFILTLVMLVHNSLHKPLIK